MPTHETCREIDGPASAGVYQIRNRFTHQLILFGIGKRCEKWMRSLFPKPYDTGKRNNAEKRAFILDHWRQLYFRTMIDEDGKTQLSLKKG